MAYSTDFRERVVAAVQGGMSRPEAVTIFRVSLATLKRWLKQDREQGHLHAQSPPGPTATIRPDAYDRLRALVDAAPDATLQDYCTQWAAQTGDQVSLATMCRALHRANLTRKKDAEGQ
jgi:transposase